VGARASMMISFGGFLSWWLFCVSGGKGWERSCGGDWRSSYLVGSLKKDVDW
jgi:hypothetical protein